MNLNVKQLFRIPINAIRITLALPFEILRKPITILAALGMIIYCIGFAFITYNHFLGDRSAQITDVLGAAGLLIAFVLILRFYDTFLYWLNPWHKWQADAAEERDFDSAYRFQRYSDSRYLEDTGIDFISDQVERMELMREQAYQARTLTAVIRSLSNECEFLEYEGVERLDKLD